MRGCLVDYYFFGFGNFGFWFWFWILELDLGFWTRVCEFGPTGDRQWMRLERKSSHGPAKWTAHDRPFEWGRGRGRAERARKPSEQRERKVGVAPGLAG